jgi:hypothetical protein
MSNSSALKGSARRVSATIAGLAMAATLTGFTVAGTASAAPAGEQAQASSSVTGENAVQVQWFYETYYIVRANCVTKGEIYEAEGYLYQCRRAERNNRTVYELWLGIERPLGALPGPSAKRLLQALAEAESAVEEQGESAGDDEGHAGEKSDQILTGEPESAGPPP